MWTLLDHCHRAQPQSKHWVFPEKHLWCLDKTIMLLFWFDYLTADVLDVLMCIEKVQNKTRHPCPTLLLSSQWTENMFRLPVITVCLVPSFDNAQALFIRNLIHQRRIHFFCSRQWDTRLLKDTKNMSSRIDSTVRKLPEATDRLWVCCCEPVYGRSCSVRRNGGVHMISWLTFRQFSDSWAHIHHRCAEMWTETHNACQFFPVAKFVSMDSVAPFYLPTFNYVCAWTYIFVYLCVW